MEDYTELSVQPQDIIVQRMVKWTAMICSRYMVGSDGLTGYGRRRGRKCKIPVVRFGEQIWYKELKVRIERRDKFDTEWRTGLMVGPYEGQQPSSGGSERRSRSRICC